MVFVRQPGPDRVQPDAAGHQGEDKRGCVGYGASDDRREGTGGGETACPHREPGIGADMLQSPCGVVTLDGGICEAQPPALRYDVSLHREPVIRVVAPREKHLA